jgi:hypothetical protein
VIGAAVTPGFSPAKMLGSSGVGINNFGQYRLPFERVIRTTAIENLLVPTF